MTIAESLAVLESIPTGRRYSETWLLVLFAFDALLQVGDGILTVIGVRSGFREGNPLLHSAMVSMGDWQAVLTAKLFGLSLLWILYQNRHHPWVMPGLWSIAFSYMVFAIVPWLSAAIVVIPWLH